MSPIKDFKVQYEPLNKEDTVSAGDTIKGIVVFTMTEETKIKCLYVKVKGDANVHWSESQSGHAGHRGHIGHGHARHGNHRSYNDHKRFYKTKEVLVEENKDGTVLPKGDHRYQFKLKIPEGNIPPSFKGFYGKIVHVLQAKMTRSWHTSTSDRRDLNFVSRTFLPTDQSPQTGSIDKEVGTFSKGKVHLSATVNKRVCSPGETLHVTAQITNKSSKKMKIKYSIDQKSVYRAMQHTKVESGTVCKIVGEAIDPDFEGKVSGSITVPADTKVSIHNCEIINVEFYLKVYLDISFAMDPEVALPLIIVAPGAIAQHGFTNTPGAIGGPSSSDFLPPFPGPYPPPVGPPAAYPPPGPVPYPNMPGGGFYNPVPGYNNQMPPQPAPYGYPPAPFMVYPGQPQASAPNAQFPPDQMPPAYMSLYPPPQNEADKAQKTQL